MGMLTAPANPGEATLAEQAVDTVRVPRRHGPPKRKVARLIADKAYDSRKLWQAFAERGTDLISPHRATVKSKWQDGRKLRRYKRRWHIERTFSWLHAKKRIWTRSDRLLSVFHGWVHLALILICLRRL